MYLSEADSSRAQQSWHDAEHELDRLKEKKENTENDAKEIFSIYGFGARGEWKQLDGTCLEKDTGECVFMEQWLGYLLANSQFSYTYEVCLFNEVKQKPNNGGTTFSLG